MKQMHFRKSALVTVGNWWEGELKVCHIKNLHGGVLMPPAQARGRKTTGDCKAFADSPSPFCCVFSQLGWALFDGQSQLGLTGPAAEEGLEDFY